jgi:hypothetical protein
MPKAISIRVAYGWDGDDVTKDKRWLGTRDFLNAVAEQARASVVKKNPGKDVPTIDIRRLRAVTGENIGNSIFKRIAETDILVADISFRKKDGRTERPANVLLELGAAMATSGVRTFILEDESKNGPLHGAADLAGLLIAPVKANAKTSAEVRTALLNENRSLKQSLVNELRRRLESRLAVVEEA